MATEKRSRTTRRRYVRAGRWATMKQQTQDRQEQEGGGRCVQCIASGVQITVTREAVCVCAWHVFCTFASQEQRTSARVQTRSTPSRPGVAGAWSPEFHLITAAQGH